MAQSISAKYILWEQTRCKDCDRFPNCPQNGDIRGMYVQLDFASKCSQFKPKVVKTSLESGDEAHLF